MATFKYLALEYLYPYCSTTQAVYLFYYEIPKKINYRQMDFISLPLPVMAIKCKYNILLPLFCVFVDVWT